MTENTIVGIIFTIMGLLGAIFHKQIARNSIEFYEKHPALEISISLIGESREKLYRIGFLISGIVVTILGLLSLFQIIKFK